MYVGWLSLIGWILIMGVGHYAFSAEALERAHIQEELAKARPEVSSDDQAKIPSTIRFPKNPPIQITRFAKKDCPYIERDGEKVHWQKLPEYLKLVKSEKEVFIWNIDKTTCTVVWSHLKDFEESAWGIAFKALRSGSFVPVLDGKEVKLKTKIKWGVVHSKPTTGNEKPESITGLVLDIDYYPTRIDQGKKILCKGKVDSHFLPSTFWKNGTTGIEGVSFQVPFKEDLMRTSVDPETTYATGMIEIKIHTHDSLSGEPLDTPKLRIGFQQEVLWNGRVLPSTRSWIWSDMPRFKSTK